MSFDGPVLPGGACTIGFIAALGIECASLRRHMPRAAPWLVEQSGPGAARAAVAARHAIDSGARLLVSWGLAGALSPAVPPGTVVLPHRILDTAAAAFAVDAAWHARLAAVGGELELASGSLLTVAAPLETPAAKRAAAAATNAVAVDMESTAIAGVAARAQVPFVVLRVVVDALDDALPPGAASWIDARGNRRITAALRAAFFPGHWGALFTLAKRYRTASGVLDRLARALAEPRLLGAEGAALPAGS